MRIEILSNTTEAAWDRYVSQRPEATFFHRAGWKKVIERSFGYPSTYITVLDNEQVVGVYPLFILKTRLFGTMGISLPYLDYGGVLADNHRVLKLLLDKAETIGRGAGCRYIELRQRFSLKSDCPVSNRKVTMVIPLRGGSEAVFSRLHQNVRNKIRKARKNNVEIQSGITHLSDFYGVYVRNLRDLGIPVITKSFFENIVNTFPEHVRVYRAVRQGKTIGSKIVVLDSETCYFIAMATIPEQLCYAPVHALNWAAIEDACHAGCSYIDMGRSTKDSKHHKFKKYWGVETQMLPWTYQLLNCNEIPATNSDNPKFSLAISIWKKLPIFLTRLIGPPLARRLPY